MPVKVKEKDESAAKADIVALAKCKILNEQGLEIDIYSLWQKTTAIFIFIRHFGCIFCRTHAKEVWQNKEKYEKDGAKIYFIGNGAPYLISGFKEELGIQDATIFTDPKLESFKAAGFRRGFLAALGPRVLLNAAKAYADGNRQGGMYRKEQGDLWQLGGILVIKPEGKVAYHFISQAAGDFSPEMDQEA